MRRFFSNANMPRSQRPEQEEDFDLELDKDIEAQGTDKEPIAVKEILGENVLGSWT